MALISVQNLTFGYDGSAELLFENASFQLDTDWRLGFVGRNGRGKTTILRLLQGELEYRGSISASVEFDYFPFPVADEWESGETVAAAICPELQHWRLLRELAALELDEGVTAHLVCSLHRRNHEVHIYCENGSIHIPMHRCPTTVTITRRKHIEGIPSYRDGSEAVTLTIPYQKSGFLFEAAAVHECLRKGLLTCPQVPPEETLTLIGICDQIRKEHGFRYPFE